MTEPTQEFVDEIAKKIALANNGGDWATHYNENQKDFWRSLAADIILRTFIYMQKVNNE